MRVLGIDPGLATVGYALLEGDDADVLRDFGVITTSPDLSLAHRMEILFDDLQALLARFEPDLVVLEELFFSTNAKTALDVSQARGVLLTAVIKSPLSPHFISLKPNEVKLGFTGDGSADKRQIQEMVCLRFGLSALPQPDDAADAIAIACVGSQHFSQQRVA